MTTITHHPDIATLMCCAAGSQPEAFAAVVACHLSVCPACREEVRRMQEIGVALFDKLEPVPVSCQPPVVAARAAEADIVPAPQPPRRPAAPHNGVPPPLSKCVCCNLDDVEWRWAAPGIWVHPIALSHPGCCGDLRLIKVAPGKALPEHGHAGSELTIVLKGAYSDETGTYREGDVSDLDDSVSHAPVACPEQGCICLMASQGKPIFASFLARLFEPLFTRRATRTTS